MAVLGSTTLTGCSSIPDFLSSGTIMFFQQTASPTSWTKLITDDDVALRVVNGAASSGGSTPFTTIFPVSTTPLSSPITLSGGVEDTTLTTAQIPAHTHTTGGQNELNNYAPAPPANIYINVQASTGFGNAGGGAAHNHPFSGTLNPSTWTSTVDLRLQYVDIIVCSKS